MPEGFKLLDAYVEVTASASGVGQKVSQEFDREITPAAKKMGAAVDAASARAASAIKRQDDAAASLRLAHLRLADVQKTAKEGSTQLAAAQEAVARAERNVAAAADSATRAHRGLINAREEFRTVGRQSGADYFAGVRSSLGSGVIGGFVGGLTSSVTSGIANIIASTVSDIGSMLTTVGGMVATTVIDYNSALESANIGFTTMLGSGRKAKGFLDELQSFAKSTPFEFTDVVRSSQRLLAMGTAAKDVIPYMTGIGDAVAGLGGGPELIGQVVTAVGQMTAKGKVQGDDLMQLTEAGIPALKILADSYGVSTSKMSDMISAGDVLAKRAVPAIIKGLESGTKSVRGFGGMMEKQSHTFAGSLSNIRDGLTQTTAKAFKPFFDAASRGMGRFATALSGKPAERFQKDVTKTLQPFAKELERWFKGIDLGKIFTSASKAVTGLAKGFNAKDFGKGLKDFGKDAGDIFRDVVRIAPKVGKALKDIGPTIGPTIKSVVDLIGTIADVVDWFDKAEPKLNAFGRSVSGPFKAGFAAVGKLVSSFLATFRHNWDVAVGILNTGGKAMRIGGQRIVDFFDRIPGQLAAIGGQLVSGFVGGITGAWGAVTSTISSLVNAIPEGVRKLLGIASPSKVFHLIGQQVGQGLHRGLLGTVDQIKTTSGRLADAVKEAFSGHLETTMVHRIARIGKALEGLSARRDKAADRLADARSRLADVLTGRKDFAANVKAGVMGNADVSSLFMASPTVMAAQAGTLNGAAYQPSWTTTAHTGLAAVKSSLKKLLADTRKFSSNLARLAKMGVDPYTYDELVQAGVRGGGLETSDALIKDPKLAGSIFTLERQVATAGRNLGNRAATHEYAGQVASARAAVRRDERAVDRIEVTMVVEARKIDEVAKLVRMVEHVKQTARKRKGKR